MTFSYEALHSSAQNKTSATTLQMFQGATALQSGDIIIVALGLNNTQTTDGTSTLVSSVVGSQSGTFTKAYEYTNGEGEAAAGATCSVWYKRLTAGISATSDTITCTFASAITAKASLVYTFHTDQSVLSVAAAQGSVNDTDPGSMTISGLASRSYLFFRAVATERGNYGFAESTNYTSLGGNTTADPGDATDMSIAAEYRIFTGTGDTTNPTTGAQSASVYLAFTDAATDTPMTAALGTYTLTGNASGLKVARKITGTTRSYSLTGNTTALKYGRKMPVTVQGFTLSGIAADFRVGQAVLGGTGSFTLTGNAVSFQRTWKLPAATGEFALTGNTALLTSAKAPLVTSVGGFALTGNPAALSHQRKVIAALGTFALTGQDVTFDRTKRLAAVRGRFEFGMHPAILRTASTSLPSRGAGYGYRYVPDKPPEDATVVEALQWALQELEKVSNVVNNISEGHMAVLHAPPDKPRDGMIRHADGTDWNPAGGGEGIYAYKESIGDWVKLG